MGGAILNNLKKLFTTHKSDISNLHKYIESTVIFNSLLCFYITIFYFIMTWDTNADTVPTGIKSPIQMIDYPDNPQIIIRHECNGYRIWINKTNTPEY